MDTIRTKMVAPGGEALGGVIDAFRHMFETEGFFSLYKGLVPSIISMAPSGAVLPSSSISYFVYELMKIVLKVEPEQVFVSFFKRYTPCNELFGK
ncbi:putative mitochondrial carrier domain superfamily [Helianthus debilis subsp. tardiflorus]